MSEIHKNPALDPPEKPTFVIGEILPDRSWRLAVFPRAESQGLQVSAEPDTQTHVLVTTAHIELTADGTGWSLYTSSHHRPEIAAGMAQIVEGLADVDPV